MSIEGGSELPNGYLMVDKYGIAPESIINLRDAAGWRTQEDQGVWDIILGQSLSVVGVEGPGQKLVGVGFLAGNVRHALLCDLVVHPKHRGIGVDQAIVRKRIELAEQMGIPYLYTELSAASGLTSLYEELGFVATGSAVYERRNDTRSNNRR